MKHIVCMGHAKTCIPREVVTTVMAHPYKREIVSLCNRLSATIAVSLMA